MKRILLWGVCFLLMSAVPVSANDVYTDNIVVLMDCSGSMSGTKIAQAKEALKQVLKTIPESTHVGLLSFGMDSGWAYELGPRDDQRLVTAIHRLRTGGSTPLGEYMKMGADRLLQQKEKQFGYGSYRLLVITDGEASDRRLMNSYTPAIMARGITVDVIGVFMNTEHSLAKMVHSYRQAKDTQSLSRAISEVLGEIDGSTSDVAASQDVFDLINSLPDAFVNQAIGALSTTAVTPIEGVKVDVNRPQAQSSSQVTTTSNTSVEKSFNFSWIVTAIIVLLILKKVF